MSLELSLSAPSVLLETDRFPLQNATVRSFVYREWNDEIIDIVVLERQIQLFANCEDRTICANARPQTALEFLRYQFEPRIEPEGIGSRSLSRTVFRPPRYKAHGAPLERMHQRFEGALFVSGIRVGEHDDLPFCQRQSPVKARRLSYPTFVVSQHCALMCEFQNNLAGSVR